MSNSEQEEFWRGSFGDEYVDRNQYQALQSGNLAYWSRVLSYTPNLDSVLELGANVGMNLDAIHALLPEVAIEAIEINEKAADHLRSQSYVRAVHNMPIQQFDCGEQSYDLVFTKGVLIHISPDDLPGVYELMAKAAKRFVLMGEYYNPTPVALPYRGHDNKLFKRDFAGEFMDAYPEFQLRDYGFAYRRDPNFLQGDITWFLMERRA